MVRMRLVFATVCATLLALTVAGAASADWSGLNRMYLTFSGRVALPGVKLEPGTYIFERADPNVDAKIVRVLSHDRRKVYLTAFTNLVDRPVNLPGDEVISFGESRRGEAPPISAWYPTHRSTGFQFIYTK